MKNIDWDPSSILRLRKGVKQEFIEKSEKNKLYFPGKKN